MHFAVAIFHGLGDCINATTILRPLKQRYPDSKITWVTVQPYAAVVRHNPCVDHVRILAGNLHCDAAKPALGRLREEFGAGLIIAGPYHNPDSKDGTLLGSYKDRIQVAAPGVSLPFIPEMNLVQPEVDDVRAWLAARKLERFVILETQYGSSQSFWNRTHTDDALKVLAKKKYSVILAHKSDVGLPDFNQVCPTYCLDLHYRYVPAVYNLASGFIGVSSGISCISHTNQCRNDIPHLEFVNGEHWSTRHYAHKLHKTISFKPSDVCPLIEKLL